MMLGLGTYPDTSLKMVREKRDGARRLLAADPPIDPSLARKARSASRQLAIQIEWQLLLKQSFATMKSLLDERLESARSGRFAGSLLAVFFGSH